MKKPASTWPTAVPTSVTRLTMPPSPDCSLIASWMLLMYSSICESLACSGPSRSQSLISWMPVDRGVGQVGGAVGHLLPGEA